MRKTLGVGGRQQEAKLIILQSQDPVCIWEGWQDGLIVHSKSQGFRAMMGYILTMPWGG
ncbi:MAG: hypothetical protein LBF40_01270 [Deltaproteobacteria bacterium]|jgi:hypothetical protein|nr:hypothetical protein [Deltaproteobacteria bacterium]